jgi:lysophospholipase L1-like esterase
MKRLIGLLLLACSLQINAQVIRIANEIGDIVLSAGPDITITTLDSILLSATTRNIDSLVWRTSGTGKITDSTEKRTYYTPSEADYLLDSVTISLLGFTMSGKDTVWTHRTIFTEYEAETRALLVRLIPMPHDTVRTLLDNWFVSVKQYDTYDSLDRFSMFAMPVEQNALVDFKVTTDSCTKGGSPVFIPYLGWYAKGGGYINTNFNPTSDAVNYSLANASFGFYVYNDTVQSKLDFGARKSTDPVTRTSAGLTDKGCTMYINNRNKGLSTLSDNKGLYSSSLTGDTVRTYSDGKYNDILATGTSILDNLDFFLGAYNLNGTVSTQATRRYQYYYVGGGLRDWHHKIIYSAGQDFLEGMGNAAYTRSTAVNVVCDGNSLTKGTAACNSGHKAYPTLLADTLVGELAVINKGIDSQTDSMMYVADADIEASWSYLTKNNVLIYWEGTNSINVDSISAEQCVDWAEAYCLKQKKRGYDIIVLTTMPRGTSDYLRDSLLAVNAELESRWEDFADGFIDVRDDARLNNQNNTTYFCDDKIHLTEAGYAVVASLVAAKIEEMY